MIYHFIYPFSTVYVCSFVAVAWFPFFLLAIRFLNTFSWDCAGFVLVVSKAMDVLSFLPLGIGILDDGGFLAKFDLRVI